MEINALLLSKNPNKNKDVEKLLDAFRHDFKAILRDAEFSLLAAKDEQEVYRIRLEVSAAGETRHMEELSEALLKRLYVFGISRGLLPIDREGNIIWLFPPYGFNVIFYSPRAGRGEEMFAITRKWYRELEGHVLDGDVGSQPDEEEGGEFFMIRIILQDYLNRDERNRLQLAAYLRLLLLAKQAGFEVVAPN